jgi:hypothetical protein
MALEIFVNSVPASDLAFDEYSVNQLDLLALQIQTLATKIEVARKGASLLQLLQSRFLQKQVVRCISQSVQTTAAARYAPMHSDMELKVVSIFTFVMFVTYLPLPNTKMLDGIDGTIN